MDLVKIKEIVNNDELPNFIKEHRLLTVLSNNDDIIPIILKILEFQRKEQRELLIDTNLELSRAFVLIDNTKVQSLNIIVPEPSFIVSEIRKHYKKWQHKIRCCFNITGLE